MKRFYCLLAVFVQTALASVASHASIELAATRLIYPARAKNVTIQATNHDASPYLMKVWVDSKDADDAENITVPFVATPPLSRIEAGDGQALRLALVGEIDTVDRESVYWLNVLAIPPTSQLKLEGKNVLQFAVRTRIKIFYRPSGLVGDANQAVRDLSWRVTNDGGAWFLECDNPTPFHVSMGEIALDGHEPITGVMAAPLATMRLKLTTAVSPGQTLKGVLSTIDDYGALIETPLLIAAGR